MRKMIGSLLGRSCSDAARSGVCIIAWSKDLERIDMYHTNSVSLASVLWHLWICKRQQAMLSVYDVVSILPSP